MTPRLRPRAPVAAAPSALSLEPLQNGDGAIVADNMSNVGGCGFYDKDGRNLLSVGIPDNYGRPEGAGGPAIGVARPNGEPTKLTAEKADAGFIEGGPKLAAAGSLADGAARRGRGQAAGPRAGRICGRPGDFRRRGRLRAPIRPAAGGAAYERPRARDLADHRRRGHHATTRSTSARSTRPRTACCAW